MNFEVSDMAMGEHTSAVIRLYDTQGQQVLQYGLRGNPASIDVRSLAQGLYYWSLITDGVRVQQGKVTVL